MSEALKQLIVLEQRFREASPYFVSVSPRIACCRVSRVLSASISSTKQALCVCEQKGGIGRCGLFLITGEQVGVLRLAIQHTGQAPQMPC